MCNQVSPRKELKLSSASKYECPSFTPGVGACGRRPLRVRRPPCPVCEKPWETYRTETVENGSFENSTGGLGAGVYQVFQWPTGAVHFCCYLWCFLHGSPSGRPGAGTATRGRVSPLGSCFLNLVSGTMHSLSQPFDFDFSMRHRLQLTHRTLRFH